MRAQAVPLVTGVRARPSSVDLPQYAWHWPGMALARHGTGPHGSVDLPQYAHHVVCTGRSWSAAVEGET